MSRSEETLWANPAVAHSEGGSSLLGFFWSALQCWDQTRNATVCGSFYIFTSPNDLCAGVNWRLELKILEEARLPSGAGGAALLGGPVMEADVADFWHQPPWGILGCNAKLWLLCLRCGEQLLFLCSRRFGCFSFEGNCWEINFF